jgi:hypothetical protein
LNVVATLEFAIEKCFFAFATYRWFSNAYMEG